MKTRGSWLRPSPGQIQKLGGIQLSLEESLRNAFMSGGSLPKWLAYEGKGVLKWARASQTKQYYQTSDEIEVLGEWTLPIAAQVLPDAVILDFGGGHLKKVESLLQAIENRGIRCSYICLDLSRKSIKKGLRHLRNLNLKFVEVSGICGTFEKGVEYLMEVPNQRIALWLGSTLFNDCQPGPEEARKSSVFMRAYPEDFMIIGQDCHTIQHKDKIEAAYHTKPFQQFIQHAVGKMCGTMGLEGDHRNWWKISCGLKEHTGGTLSHHFLLEAKQDIRWDGITIKTGAVHEFFESRKSRPEQLKRIFHGAELWTEISKAPGSENCSGQKAKTPKADVSLFE
ncbi:hypothetical protein S40293_09770 [Stachybotrys chartarum IBT 40293]|nr:hypothetical protein S40293_09770 [Stachybotrys chartarum IBT 40293]